MIITDGVAYAQPWAARGPRKIMHPIAVPHEAPASHEVVLAVAEKAVAAGLDGNVRVVVARDPRDASSAWRPACGRLDLARRGDPPPIACRPRGSARILEERVEGAELLRRLRRAMKGETFEVCGEEFADHGMESAWGAYQHTRDWSDYGATWPCIVASPSAQIPRRLYLHEIIEDDGPHRVHDGLEDLVRHASGFRVTHGPGIDIRFSRFQLLVWDYRGRIDAMVIDKTRVVIEVSPKDDPSLKLVGVVAGERTRTPIAVLAPGEASVRLEEPVLLAKVALKFGEMVVAEAQRDFRQEALIAHLEGRALPHDPCEQILDALARSLRPAFRDAPSDEKEVQREVEKILRVLGVPFHREKERAALGATTFVPDFTVPDLALALEVKLAKKGHGEAAIQRELAQDAAGYGTKWSNVIVVVYDCGGGIRDPERMRLASEKLGLLLLVVKH